jgi:hypothetical protein
VAGTHRRSLTDRPKRNGLACHTRSTRHGEQRSVTGTDGDSRASDQDPHPRRSRGRSCYRSSKLVMRVRFPSPARDLAGHGHDHQLVNDLEDVRARCVPSGSPRPVSFAAK